MIEQRTIGKSFTLEGKGLHTGLQIILKACPAPENHGIRIKRVDLPEQPEIEALAEYVSQTTRGTVLKSGDFQVSTIEHAMAAFYALGIDNVLFEVDAPEFPILDGSAAFYIKEIQEAGVVCYPTPKKQLNITEAIELTNASGSHITVLPNDGFEVEVEIGFNSAVLPNQKASLSNLANFADQMSAARTFVFVREIEPLLQMNLIKGGDLKNAIVIYDKEMSQESLDALTDKLNQARLDATQLGYLSGELKYENEPARHKLLDVIGDIALVGAHLNAKIIARYPGHQINTETAKLIRQKAFLTEVK